MLPGEQVRPGVDAQLRQPLGEPCNSGPIEVWLTQFQSNLGITCTVVRDDESTEKLDVDSLSMRGAQRELTGYRMPQGYTPDGRWSTVAETDVEGTLEAMRRSKPTGTS